MIRQGFAGLLGVAAACMVMADIGAQGGRQSDPPKPKPPATQTEKPKPPATQTEKQPPAEKRTVVRTVAGEGHKAPKAQPTSETAQTAGQPAGTPLGSVRVSQNVRANGESLPAGTYSVRLVSEAVPGKVGQTPEFSRWVEFLQGGKVRGKELCTVLSSGEISKVVKDAPPPSGGSKTELLVGNDYLRVWINRGKVHYLVYLAASGE